MAGGVDQHLVHEILGGNTDTVDHPGAFGSGNLHSED